MDNQFLEPSSEDRQDSVDAIVEDVISGNVPSVEQGVTLPPEAYTSQAFFDLEREAIFKKDWLCVGHVGQIPNVGDYFTLELIGEPMVVVRGKDQIRVMSTVCQHRWVPVAQGSGNTSAFSCPFHKWTYGLDGALIGAPQMQEAQGFDKKNCRLHEFRSEVIEELGLVFVTFSDSIAPASERFASLIQRVRDAGWTLKDQAVIGVLEQTNTYNWKIQVETYVECYHHLGGHNESLQRAMPAEASWCEDDKGTWTLCNTGLSDTISRLEGTDQYRGIEAFVGKGNMKDGATIGQITVLYPSTLLSFIGDSCDLRILSPVSPGVTKSVLVTTKSKEFVASPEYGAWLEEFYRIGEVVNNEDNRMNDLQQIGVASAYSKPGRFSHLEACAWHLSQYVRRMIEKNKKN